MVNHLNNPVSRQNTHLNELMLRIAQHKDTQAFSELYTACASRLKGYAMQCGASAGDAEELLQETLITVWQKAHLFKPESASAMTWLFTIIRNKRIDALRKNSPDRVISLDLWPEPLEDKSDETPESDTESDLESRIVRTMIDTLPNEQRQIVHCVYFQGKSHSEIADELGLPLGTIKSRLRLAMKKLDSMAKEQMTWLIIILLTNF